MSLQKPQNTTHKKKRKHPNPKQHNTNQNTQKKKKKKKKRTPPNDYVGGPQGNELKETRLKNRSNENEKKQPREGSHRTNAHTISTKKVCKNCWKKGIRTVGGEPTEKKGIEIGGRRSGGEKKGVDAHQNKVHGTVPRSRQRRKSRKTASPEGGRRKRPEQKPRGKAQKMEAQAWQKWRRRRGDELDATGPEKCARSRQKRKKASSCGELY